MVKAHEKRKRGRLVVLMVDDNMLFIERMVTMLDEIARPNDITIASDYNEAVRFIKEEIPDVVLLDINLPGKSGIEILKLIRSTGNECKVIMLTNHADDYYREQCREYGADFFLDKSNDFAKVPDIIIKLRNDMDPLPLEAAC